ncbi:MAG: hypothetical protein LBG12_14305 [Synergistaceae bacterium]|jgi:hypothetical protein|nr:hypothetical protein [Synergistaceae bacterium]
MTTTEVTTTIRNLKELMNMREELEAEITATTIFCIFLWYICGTQKKKGSEENP